MFLGIPLLQLSAGVCLSASLLLSQCDEKQDALDRIQQAHQLKVENCQDHSNPQECIDLAIAQTNSALDEFQNAWALTEAEDHQSKREFKESLIEKIMNIADPVIREILLKIVQEEVGPKEMNVSMLGVAAISDLPALTDAATLTGSIEAMESAGLVHGDGRDSDLLFDPANPGTPIRLINKVLTINTDVEFELFGTVETGILTGQVIVQVGEGQTGPRQIRVVSGTLTLDSEYSGMEDSPINMTVKKNGRSSMVVSADGHTTLRLDLDASMHPLSYGYDQNPFLEVPMIEATADTFQVNVANVPFDYIHVWHPWPVSDFDKNGLYNASDIGAFSIALANQDFRTDLNMDGFYTSNDLDLFLRYHAEDVARSQFQSNRFIND